MGKKKKQILIGFLMFNALVFGSVSTSWSYTYNFDTYKLYTYNSYYTLNSNTRCVVSYYSDHYKITFEKYKYVYSKEGNYYYLKWVGETSWNVAITDSDDPLTFKVEDGDLVANFPSGAASFIVSSVKDFIMKKVNMVAIDPIPNP